MPAFPRPRRQSAPYVASEVQVPPATTPVQYSAGTARPEFIRLPAVGEREPYTGLARSTLNELILPCEANDNRPPVPSKVIRRKGAVRGIRLIPLESLLSYLHSLGAEQQSTNTSH